MDVLAAELPGVANRLTAILPWGGLLRALVSPESSSFVSLRRLCARNATLEIVFSYDWKRDAREGGPLGALRIDDAYVRGLAATYKNAGFEATFVERISRSELRSYETTWARRLAFGEPREIWRLRALSS